MSALLGSLIGRTRSCLWLLEPLHHYGTFRSKHCVTGREPLSLSCDWDTSRVWATGVQSFRRAFTWATGGPKMNTSSVCMIRKGSSCLEIQAWPVTSELHMSVSEKLAARPHSGACEISFAWNAFNVVTWRSKYEISVMTLTVGKGLEYGNTLLHSMCFDIDISFT
jgi:hypothetical protein